MRKMKQRTPKELLLLFGLALIALACWSPSVEMTVRIARNQSWLTIDAPPRQPVVVIRAPSPALSRNTPKRTLASLRRPKMETQQQQKQVSPVELRQRNNTSGMTFYSRARTDRTGATLIDMLYAHSFAFHNNATYAGACRNQDDPRISRYIDHVNENDHEKKLLIENLGLENVVPYAIPCPQSKKVAGIKKIRAFQYRGSNAPGFTKEWLEYIRSQVKYPDIPKPSNTKMIVVHIRRGDISACHIPQRYIPNKFFIRLIDELKEKYKNQGYNTNITVFTERSWSLESVDELADLGYEIDMKDDLSNIWRHMMVADVLVMSRSSFPSIPAMLNGAGTIIYPIYTFKLLDNWEYPSEELLELITSERKRLQSEYCPHLVEENKKGYHFDPDQNEAYQEFRRSEFRGSNMTVSTQSIMSWYRNATKEISKTKTKAKKH